MFHVKHFIFFEDYKINLFKTFSNVSRETLKLCIAYRIYTWYNNKHRITNMEE